jgi:hypothetical protein
LLHRARWSLANLGNGPRRVQAEGPSRCTGSPAMPVAGPM